MLEKLDFRKFQRLNFLKYENIDILQKSRNILKNLENIKKFNTGNFAKTGRQYNNNNIPVNTVKNNFIEMADNNTKVKPRRLRFVEAAQP